jgi:16S rRNA (cytosine967-C5)-methyltransferase
MASTQAALLDALWPVLRPGGRLLYATCSVFKAEGVHQIDAFLQRAPDAIERPSPGYLLPVADNPKQGSEGPSRPSTDGFYYALLEKRSS